MDPLNLFIAGIVGLSVGSFLNVCIDRLPVGQSLISPPSSCPECGTPIRIFDIIPVVSYVVLRGKCRDCSTQIPFRILLVELATGVLFVLIWARYGLSYEGIAMMGYASYFMVVLVIDLERQVILNLLVISGFAASLVVASFWPDIGPARAATGAGVGFGLLLAMYLVPGAIMGEGDVKLAAVVGAATGFPLVAVGLGLAFVSGGLAAAALLATGKRTRKDRVPFGPFLAAGAMVTLVWGDTILDWYTDNFWAV